MARQSARAKRNAASVKGDWGVLPHGMGVRPVSRDQPTSPVTGDQRDLELNDADHNDASHQPVSADLAGTTRNNLTLAADVTTEPQLSEKITSKEAENENSLDTRTPPKPQGLTQNIKEEVKDKEVTLRRSKRIRARVTVDDNDNARKTTDPTTGLLSNEQVTSKQADKNKDSSDAHTPEETQTKPKRVPRKTKDNPYGLTPGRSPFPDWQGPSAAQCEEVYEILANMHGKLEQPEVIPTPSLEVAGCGEVPFVLEALLRTLLSGAVTMDGAGKMVQGIVAKYGVLEDELAKGAIDWNKVRLSTIEDLQDAIRVGGLANRKAKAIKNTLDMVYEENINRRNAFLAERETGITADVYGAAERTQGQKELEILKTERDILSLDHMYGLSVDKAMREFTKFPGIGVKTAACVILFCLQRPCFAVDTHVHRFSRWLGWVPDKADENDTFGHLEVRCPDHLKYGLHQLFIKHGQTCGRCKLATVEGTKDWEAVVCPLEHLLTRGKKTSKAKGKPPKSKSPKASSEEGDSEPELSEAEGTIVDENEDEEHEI
ncbi:DNA glycosylase [Xylaria intraflava]|nr:DNA glycosylase [Xylaria intraflava]